MTRQEYIYDMNNIIYQTVNLTFRYSVAAVGM